MKYKSIFLLLTVSSVMNYSNAVSLEIHCNFTNDEFDSFLDQYTCSVQQNFTITSKNTQIESIQGTHKSGQNNDDVTGLSIRDKIVNYMPVNLADKLKNLVAIRIRNGKLKEVTKNDLKPFTKLRFLNLDANDLEVLNDDLFEYNPLLEVIWFEGNKIKIVGESTFENLKNLRDLDLSGNDCISLRVKNNSQMTLFTQQIKLLCYDLDNELKKLKQQFFKLSNSKLITDNVDSKFTNIMKQMSNFTALVLNFTDQITERNIKLQMNMKQLLEHQKKKEEKLQYSELSSNYTEHNEKCGNAAESIKMQNISQYETEANANEKRTGESFLVRHIYTIVIGLTLLVIISVVNLVIINNAEF